MTKDPEDKRSRRLSLTEDGLDLLTQAVPIWRKTHDDVDKVLARPSPEALKEDLISLAFKF